MAYESRRNGRYLYLKRREGKRVVSQYVPVAGAPLSGPIDAATKAYRRAGRIGERHFEVFFSEMNAALDASAAAVGVLADAARVDCGYHRRNGEWRRRRTVPSSDPMTDTGEYTILEFPPDIELPALLGSNADRELATTLARDAWSLRVDLERAVASGDATECSPVAVRATGAVREGLAAWAEAGDRLRASALTTLRVVEKADPEARTALLAEAGRLRADLGWQTLAPLERMLADQFVLAWLSAEVTRWVFERLAYGKPGTEALGLAWDRRLAAAERRAQQAAHALAKLGREVGATKGTRAAYARAGKATEAPPDPLAFIAEELAPAEEEPWAPGWGQLFNIPSSMCPPPFRVTRSLFEEYELSEVEYQQIDPDDPESDLVYSGWIPDDLVDELWTEETNTDWRLWLTDETNVARMQTYFE